MVWVGIILLVLMFIAFVAAVEKVKYGEYDHTPWLLISMGIYQWGQALVLSSFWMVYAVACILWWTPQKAMQMYIIFHVTRAIVELFLIGKSDYQGLASLIMPNSKTIHAHQRIQLYSLCQGLIITGGLLLLLPNIFI